MIPRKKICRLCFKGYEEDKLQNIENIHVEVLKVLIIKLVSINI